MSIYTATKEAEVGSREESVEEMLERSNDFVNTGSRARSGIRHDLMDIAERSNDLELWDKIGVALMVATRRDDISAKVSDHFVQKCPDKIFKKYALQGPRRLYVAWYKRARDLLPEHFSHKKKI